MVKLRLCKDLPHEQKRPLLIFEFRIFLRLAVKTRQLRQHDHKPKVLRKPLWRCIRGRDIQLLAGAVWNKVSTLCGLSFEKVSVACCRLTPFLHRASRLFQLQTGQELGDACKTESSPRTNRLFVGWEKYPAADRTRVSCSQARFYLHAPNILRVI